MKRKLALRGCLPVVEEEVLATIPGEEGVLSAERIDASKMA